MKRRDDLNAMYEALRAMGVRVRRLTPSGIRSVFEVERRRVLENLMLRVKPEYRYGPE